MNKRIVLYIPGGVHSRNFSFSTGLSYYGMPIQSWADAKLLSKFIKKQETAYLRHPERFGGAEYDRLRLMSEAARYLDKKNNSSVYSAIINNMTPPAPAAAAVPEAVADPDPQVPPAVSGQPAKPPVESEVTARPGVVSEAEPVIPGHDLFYRGQFDSFKVPDVSVYDRPVPGPVPQPSAVVPQGRCLPPFYPGQGYSPRGGF